MDQVIIENELSKFPKELKIALVPFSSDKALAVYLAILDSHEGMRYNEIKGHFNTRHSGEIDRCLKRLSQSGLIEKRFQSFDELGNKEVGLYNPTYFGESLIKSMLSIYHPKVRRDVVLESPYLAESYSGSSQKRVLQYVPRVVESPIVHGPGSYKDAGGSGGLISKPPSPGIAT